MEIWTGLFFSGISPSRLAAVAAPLFLTAPGIQALTLLGLDHRCWVLFDFELIGLSAARLLCGFLNS